MKRYYKDNDDDWSTNPYSTQNPQSAQNDPTSFGGLLNQNF